LIAEGESHNDFGMNPQSAGADLMLAPEQKHRNLDRTVFEPLFRVKVGSPRRSWDSTHAHAVCE
jgi:hypothetical protein